MPPAYNHDHENEITLFGEVNFRNAGRRFGIKTDDRRRHVYIIGKTGMGKSTLMENMILADIYAGHGCCYIDPHGDVAEKLMDFIPPERINDVVYFNPADTAFPVGFNILETSGDPDRKHLVRDGLMGVFKKIWPDVWSARMEYILTNCISALLDYPGATLMGVNRLLVDKEYREKVVEQIRDPVVKTFWVAEYASWDEKYATEAGAAIQNKVGQFLSSGVVRNIVAQVKSTIDIRKIMDEGKILIVNLSKGRIGEDGMRLLGGMIVTKIQLSAQERQNMEEKDRRDFYFYVDEFQNFANESFATILSEARKYRLNLIVAHQYMAQLEEEVQDAVLGNVGTMIIMRVGPQDAELLETEFAPTFTPEDLVSLAKFQMYLKLMVDGVSTQPFSANSLPPIAKRTGSFEKTVQISRERYAEARHIIEGKVLKWSGMEFVHLPPAGTPAGQAPVGTPREGSLAEAIIGTEPPPSPTLKMSPVVHYSGTATESEASTKILADEHAVGISMPTLVMRPERLSAIEEARKAIKAASKMRKKPSFSHTCQRCGKVFELAVQLDPSKPIYCPECRDLIKAEREARQQGRPSSGSGAGGGSSIPRRDGSGPARPGRESSRPPRREEGAGSSRPAGGRPRDRRPEPSNPQEAPREPILITPRVKPPTAPVPASSASAPAAAPSSRLDLGLDAAPSTPPSPALPTARGTVAPGETIRF